MALASRRLPRIASKLSLHNNFHPPTICFNRCIGREPIRTKQAEVPDVPFLKDAPMTERILPFSEMYIPPRQTWVTNINTLDSKKLGLVDLHPSIFAEMPRIDIIYHNLRWQQKYRNVDFRTERSRAEMPGGGRKPWPQKGTGRARHGSIRSPLWIRGGKAHGHRGPKTFFYMPPHHYRVRGLTCMLSCKFAQDDLVIVDSLDIPSENQQYIDDIVRERKWGLSVLFINHCEVMPKNITLATEGANYYTLMPYYGLNVYSMLKYDTVVLTLEALNKIEERLLFNLHRADSVDVNEKFDTRRYNQKLLKHSHLNVGQINLKDY